MSETHTETPWEFTNYTKFDGSPILTPQDVAEITAESALKSDIAELWGVSIPGPDGPVICYTGNGPTSKANAAFIAKACNSHDDLLLAAEAHLAWSWAEHQGGTVSTFDERMELCKYAEWLTERAVVKSRGGCPAGDYEGVPRMFVWPIVGIQREDAERASERVAWLLGVYRLAMEAEAEAAHA